MVELVAIGVRSLMIATSLLKVLGLYWGCMVKEAAGDTTPPELRFYDQISLMHMR